jgi:FkbM family methyltransferase
MKRTLLNIANAGLRPFGMQVYKDGMDMESVLRRLGKSVADIATVVDIGASNGRWSRMCMPFFPRANFIGIDPLAEREPFLKSLKERNPRFDYMLCAAGEEDDQRVTLSVSSDLDGSTVDGSGGEVREVSSWSIDGIMAMKQYKGPYLLKFDTHGAEVPILNGCTRTLEQTSYVVMEVYNYRHTPGTLLFHEMCNIMEKNGFRCFNMADPMQRLLDRSLWQMDFFFARSDDPVFASDSYR